MPLCSVVTLGMSKQCQREPQEASESMPPANPMPRRRVSGHRQGSIIPRILSHAAGTKGLRCCVLMSYKAFCSSEQNLLRYSATAVTGRASKTGVE